MAKQVSHLTVIVNFAPLCLVCTSQSAQCLVTERSNFNDTAAIGRPSVGRDPTSVRLGWSLGGPSSQVSAMAPVHASMKQNLITTSATTCPNRYNRQFVSRHSSTFSRRGNASSRVDTSCLKLFKPSSFRGQPARQLPFCPSPQYDGVWAAGDAALSCQCIRCLHNRHPASTSSQPAGVQTVSEVLLVHQPRSDRQNVCIPSQPAVRLRAYSVPTAFLTAEAHAVSHGPQVPGTRPRRVRWGEDNEHGISGS